MIGFTATARDRDITLRDGELEHARWYTRDELVAAVRGDELRVASPLSISWSLLEHWLSAQDGVSLAALAAERGR